MLAVTENKKFVQKLLLMEFILLISACVTHEDTAYQNTLINMICPGEVNDDIDCSVHLAQSEYKRSVHAEYYQQLLPTHERSEVIEQEIEDARNKN
ncbi:MAG: hypothetical protein ACJAVV_002800 [Alphaproteobacteria bacterium]|jgi:hypothetical protein